MFHFKNQVETLGPPDKYGQVPCRFENGQYGLLTVHDLTEQPDLKLMKIRREGGVLIYRTPFSEWESIGVMGVVELYEFLNPAKDAGKVPDGQTEV